MSDRETKGFRIVDRRGVEREEPQEPRKDAAPSPPTPTGGTGNREGTAGVRERKSPDARSASLGGPTFLDLVMTLQMGAMVNLGMVQSPDGRRAPVNIPSAKDSIDMLEVLQAKTKGNLTEEETGMLTEGLYHLRMAYVAAVNAVASAGGDPEGGGKGS
jgi:hypothetical protein